MVSLAPAHQLTVHPLFLQTKNVSGCCPVSSGAEVRTTGPDDLSRLPLWDGQPDKLSACSFAHVDENTNHQQVLGSL